MPKRLLIVEEALKNRRGHWYEYNRNIIEEARFRGIEVTILAHRDVENSIKNELKCKPFFPVTCWDQVYAHPSAWRRYLGILHHNFRISRLLSRHFAAESKPYDVVLVPTVVLYHWLAWRWLVFRGATKWFKKVILTTRNNAGEYDPATKNYTFNASAKVLAAVLKGFRGVVEKGNVEMASDSMVLAAQYKSLCGIPFHTYPHPRRTDHLGLPMSRSQTETVFTALGPPRYEKGSDLIVEAIRSILSNEADFPGRFVIHWTDRVFSPEGKETVLPIEWDAHQKVEIIRNSLDTAEYQHRLDEADVLLLPYRRAQYHARLSGIAIEAFQSGVPCICISDTWVEECMRAIGVGVAIEEETLTDLTAAIRKFATNPPVFPAERIILARKTHSPQSFVDRLFQNPSILRTLN